MNVVVVGGFVVSRGADVVNCKDDAVEGNSEDDARNDEGCGGGDDSDDDIDITGDDAVGFDEKALVVSDKVCCFEDCGDEVDDTSNDRGCGGGDVSDDGIVDISDDNAVANDEKALVVSDKVCSFEDCGGEVDNTRNDEECGGGDDPDDGIDDVCGGNPVAFDEEALVVSDSLLL